MKRNKVVLSYTVAVEFLELVTEGIFYQWYTSSWMAGPSADTTMDQAGMYPLKSLTQSQ